MVVIFPGSPIAIVGMAIAMETAKLITAGFLGRWWSSTPTLWRIILIVSYSDWRPSTASAYSASSWPPMWASGGEAQSSVEIQDAALVARIDVQAHKVADLDRRLGQVDSAIEEATRHGRTKTALAAMEGQRKARGSLAEERDRGPGSRQNAPQWRRAGARSRRTRRRSNTSPSWWGSTRTPRAAEPTARKRSGG
jgi:hypothetical protein